MKARISVVLLSVAALATFLSLSSRVMAAQGLPDPGTAFAEPLPTEPDAPPTAPRMQRFTGVIVERGERLVLSESESRAVYQLDDQQKVRDFLNQNVNIMGTLDAGTSTIRVSIIGPA